MNFILSKRNNLRQNVRCGGWLFTFLSILFGLQILVTEAFQGAVATHDSSFRPQFPSWSRHTRTTLNVLAEPPRNALPTEIRRVFSNRRTGRNVNLKKKRSNPSKKEDVWSSGRWNRAIQIEGELLSSLELLEHAIQHSHTGEHDKELELLDSLSFPPIRDCNAALAAFGDGEDLLRALRLYFKMRKAASLIQRYYPRIVILPSVPTPTLVTFSTIMSRAVQLGKPVVAIRLWNSMRRQTDFFSACSSVPPSLRIVPDVKAANILMNCYAKLGYVESAQDLLHQMIAGDGEDVPRMTPNLVTFNTLLDACFKARELDVALDVKQQIEDATLVPDARTYTTLIATVARKTSSTSGVNDPTLAFSLLQEMQARDIRPNGMTYSALIDVCGRCRRSDLALKGLRLMADQKAQEQKLLDLPPGKRHTLPAEVGAWTAAINACGKTEKIETALKLFYAMPNFGVYPNTVTCGCLTDCLLRQGRTADSLEVLRYMKKNRIAPSEVMYTSLMTSASRLAQYENAKQNVQLNSNSNSGHVTSTFPVDESGVTSAVEVYTELMKSLLQSSKNRQSASGSESSSSSSKSDGSKELYRVSLVFQEMKAAGVEPDLACYNALLKSCANAGDVSRASEILEQIRNSDNMAPNDNTWREILRAAAKANRIDIALSTWKVAIKELNEAESIPSHESRLSAESAVALLEALIKGSSDAEIDRHTQLRLYQLVANVCEAIISGSSYLGMNLVDRQNVLENTHAMVIFLQALVTLENSTNSFQDSSMGLNRKKLRLLAISIVASACFDNGLPYKLRQHTPYIEAYSTAQKWWEEERLS